MPTGSDPWCDINPRWLCLLVTAAPVVVGCVLAWCLPAAPRPTTGDAGRTPAAVKASDLSTTRR